MIQGFNINGVVQKYDYNSLENLPGGGGSITVDSALSTSSTNPVQNKVITGALPSQASINSSGVISFKNSAGTALFTLQLPIYSGGVS